MGSKRWVALLVVFLALGGCEGAYRAEKVPLADVEDRETFVLLTKSLQGQVTVEGQRAKWNEANLLEVQARIRNRTEEPLQVEVQTVFKDAEGFSTDDEAVWRRLMFEPNETKIYRVNSLNPKARRFTIRVREVQ
ncbi:MAG: YcfL family protein [Gemmatimonadota bacterium]